MNQRQQTEHIAYAVLADQIECAQRDDGDHHIIAAHHGAAFAADHSRQRQQGDNGDVLKQQDGKGAVAVRGFQRPFIAHDLHAKRGGGQRKRQPDDRRGAQRHAKKISDACE